MPLNADQLDAFWMIAQTGSFHRAAEALFISQSAVSQRLQALEVTLGEKLLVRAGRTITLTDAGQHLIRYCREQRQAETVLINSLVGKSTSLVGRLAVAAGSSEGTTWLLPVLAEIGCKNPDLDLSITIDDAMDPVALLESGKVDVVLGETPLGRRGIRSIRIAVVPYVLAVSPLLAEAWPDCPDRALLSRVRAIDFSPLDRGTLDFLALCLPGEDFSDLRRYFVNNMQGLIAWVVAGGGYSALPLPLIMPYLAQNKLRLLYPEVQRERNLYWSIMDGVSSPALHLLNSNALTEAVCQLVAFDNPSWPRFVWPNPALETPIG